MEILRNWHINHLLVKHGVPVNFAYCLTRILLTVTDSEWTDEQIVEKAQQILISLSYKIERKKGEN